MTATVCCLYGRGGEFTRLHVARWADMVRRHVSRETRLACLTDAGDEVEGMVDAVWPLLPQEASWGWQGTWPKLALFKQKPPCLYLDLDVNVVGSLEPMVDLAARHQTILCRDFWNCYPPLANGSVIGWGGDMLGLYLEFSRNPDGGKVCDGSVAVRHWSDQLMILRYVERHQKVVYWQDLLPGAILSYKNEVIAGADASKALVIVSHGKPRPWEVGGADRIRIQPPA